MTWPEIDRRSTASPVEATVVGATPGAGPIPAMVVGDRRDFFGKRLGAFALAILLLFFVISSYIQSARNGVLLERASKDRSDLINSLQAATVTIDRQSNELRDIRKAFAEQNRLLRKAGIETVVIVPSSENSSTEPQLAPRPSEIFASMRQPNKKPSPTPAPSTSGNRPSPKPSPTQSPTILDKVCEISGVVCIYSGRSNEQCTTSLWRPDSRSLEVYCPSSASRSGNAVLQSGEPVAPAKR